jgi:hypothetical protein
MSLQKNETPGRGYGRGFTNFTPNHQSSTDKATKFVSGQGFSRPDDYLPMNWPTWFPKFGPELLPVIPPDAESDTIAKPLRGKCPGYRNANGKWWGFKGQKLVDIFLTEEQAITAYKTGACIGIQGRKFPGLDIDVGDESLADEIERHAFATLGPAPVRRREGSSRRLLMYSGSGLHRLRHAFRHPSMKPEDKDWAVEFLATGQYYNVEGTHPSGARYFWRGDHPTTLVPFGLSEIDEDAVKACFSKS